jgi:hypothetical protein
MTELTAPAAPRRAAQQLADGRWRVALDGFPDVTTDELTLDDVEIAERVCGVPYVLINPLASAKEAKALLTVMLVRAGIPEGEALKAAGKTTLRKLATAFTYELPDRQSATGTPSGDGKDSGPPR